MIGPPDNHHLAAAIGWLELGNHVEAGEEIARISPEHWDDPDVLEARWQVCAAGPSWDAALAAAEKLLAVAPERLDAWLHHAYALRRSSRGSLQAAAAALWPAYDKFPEAPIVAYNLACYAAQLGDLDEAWQWLQSAIARAGDARHIKEMAQADPDLQPLSGKLKAL